MKAMETLHIFSIWHSNSRPSDYRRIRWTETGYSDATVRSYSDYIEEVERGGNECAEKIAYLITAKNNKFIYWRDYETEEYFVTPIC